MEGLEEKRTVGRPRITEQLGITDERIVSLYKELGTVKKVAEHLHVTTRTLRKYLQRNGVKPIGMRPTAKSWLSRRPSAVYTWLREYTQSGQPVPRNTIRMAELSGCTRRQVQDFLERRKHAAKKLLESMGTTPKGGVFTDSLGRRFRSDAIAQCKLAVDTFDMTVRLTCILRNNISCVVQMPFKRYVEMLKAFATETEGTDQ